MIRVSCYWYVFVDVSLCEEQFFSWDFNFLDWNPGLLCQSCLSRIPIPIAFGIRDRDWGVGKVCRILFNLSGFFQPERLEIFQSRYTWYRRPKLRFFALMRFSFSGAVFNLSGFFLAWKVRKITDVLRQQRKFWLATCLLFEAGFAFHHNFNILWFFNPKLHKRIRVQLYVWD